MSVKREPKRGYEKLLEELELKLDNLLLAQAIHSLRESVSLEELYGDYEKSTGNKLNPKTR